jgi:hypothetical protein
VAGLGRVGVVTLACGHEVEFAHSAAPLRGWYAALSMGLVRAGTSGVVAYQITGFRRGNR